MQYSQEELKIIQEAQIVILEKIAQVCDKHNIPYFLACGTLIGAVRHKGYIPWDDDIDIVMLQEDYDKFLEIAQEELGPNYFVQTFETDPNYPMISAKVRCNEVKFVEDYLRNIDMNHGLYVDVFPFYKQPVDDEERAKHIKKSKQLNDLYLLKSCPYTGQIDVNKSKYMIKQAIKLFVSKVLLLPVSRKRLYKKIYEFERKYAHIDTPYVGTNNPRFGATIDQVLPAKTIEFEGRQFSCYNDVHACLTRHFGDYMQLPPENQRVNHRPYFVDYEAAKIFIEKNK